MKLIVGLGNPGLTYARNRHNAGAMALQHFARLHHISLDRRLGKARVGQGIVAGQEVLLARPQTYMNLSGGAVAPLVRRFQIPLSDLLVISDDLDLLPGKLRLRPGGRAGGHKGLESIIAHLGSQEFPRLRLGIGRPSEPSSEEEIVDYVLSDFTLAERETMEQVLSRAAEALECFLSQGIEAAMNRYNK